MTTSWRGFRYQTGEVGEIAQNLKAGKLVEADIDKLEELEELIEDLKQEGIYLIEGMPFDPKARDLVEEPQFHARVGFYSSPVKAEQADKEKVMFIDFFLIEEEEKGYDEIFWG